MFPPGCMFPVGPVLLSSGAHFYEEYRKEGEDTALGPKKLTVSEGAGGPSSFPQSLGVSSCPHSPGDLSQSDDFQNIYRGWHRPSLHVQARPLPELQTRLIDCHVSITAQMCHGKLDMPQAKLLFYACQNLLPSRPRFLLQLRLCSARGCSSCASP